MADILIAAGADLNAKNKVTVPGVPLAAADSVLVDGQNGNTPLHRAASSNQCEVAKVLIAAGADLNAKNKVDSPVPLAAADSVLVDGQNGNTPPDRAKGSQAWNMVKLLEAAVLASVARNQKRIVSTT